MSEAHRWRDEVIEWGCCGSEPEPEPEPVQRRLEIETGVITGERNRSGQAGEAANRARWTGGGGGGSGGLAAL